MSTACFCHSYNAPTTVSPADTLQLPGEKYVVKTTTPRDIPAVTREEQSIQSLVYSVTTVSPVSSSLHMETAALYHHSATKSGEIAQRQQTPQIQMNQRPQLSIQNNLQTSKYERNQPSFSTNFALSVRTYCFYHIKIANMLIIRNVFIL